MKPSFNDLQQQVSEAETLMGFGAKARVPKKAVEKPKLPVTPPPTAVENIVKVEPLSEKMALALHKANKPRKTYIPILESLAVVSGHLITTDLQRTLLTKTATKGGMYILIAGELHPDVGSDLNEFPVIPNLPDMQTHGSFTLTSEALQMLYKASEFVSTDELRPAMCQIAVIHGNIVATNGHYLYLATANEFPKETSFLVDPKTVALLKKAKPSTVSMALYGPIGAKLPEYLETKFRDAVLISKLCLENFPNYKSVLPQEAERTMGVNRQELIGHLKYLQNFASSMTNQVICDTTDVTTLHLRAEDIDRGIKAERSTAMTFFDKKKVKSPQNNVRLVMPINVNMDKTETESFGFKIEYLITALESLESETVNIHYTIPRRAFVFTEN